MITPSMDINNRETEEFQYSEAAVGKGKTLNLSWPLYETRFWTR